MIEECKFHSGVDAEIKELREFRDRQEGTNGINQRFREQINALNSKLWMIMGGVFVLWPSVQFIMYILERGKK